MIKQMIPNDAIHHCVIIGTNAAPNLKCASYCIIIGAEAGEDLFEANHLLVIEGVGKNELVTALRFNITEDEWHVFSRMIHRGISGEIECLYPIKNVCYGFPLEEK